MDTIISTLMNAMRSVLAPPACVLCKKSLEQGSLCKTCLLCVLPVVSVRISLTATQSMIVHAACAYEEPVRRLVLSKRHGSIAGSYALAELIWHKTMLDNLPCDNLVPIPLHWTRFWMRGFNQSHEIARILAHKKGCACTPIITRARRTRYQADVPKAERGANVHGVFELSSSAQQYAHKHLVLIDDLMTTGSTLKVAAKQLLKLQPASITAIVACRTR